MLRQDPFATFGSAKFEVTNALGGKVAGPVDHGFVVLVENHRVSDIRERGAHRDELFGKVVKPYCEIVAFVDGPYLGFA